MLKEQVKLIGKKKSSPSATKLFSILFSYERCVLALADEPFESFVIEMVSINFRLLETGEKHLILAQAFLADISWLEPEINFVINR